MLVKLKTNKQQVDMLMFVQFFSHKLAVKDKDET